MSAKKCCCCGLLSCFPCFSDKKSTLSAQPDSSQIAPPPLTVITNPSPAATLSSAPPSAAVPSQVNASTVMQNASQPIAPSAAVPSSSIPTTSQTTASPPTQPPSSSTPSSLIPAISQTTASPPTQPASSSTPSSSALIPTASQTTASPPTQPASSSTPSSSRLRKESDYAEYIKEAGKEVDKENVDGDLSDLIKYISQLFDFIEEKEKEKEKKKKGKNSPSKPEATRNYWPGSIFFFKLKEVLAEGIEGIKDVPTGDAKTIALDLVKRAGMAHLLTAGFLVVANILERYEAISTNEGVCLSLLKEMDKLARHVNELRKRPELKESMVDSIREAIALIVEASLACCTQMTATKVSKFFSTAVNGEELANFKTRLAETDTHMQRNFNLSLYDAIVLRRQNPMELQYPEHLKDAVGIEKQLEKVIERLEMGSDKSAVAVIVHGFGGMGKTTLANAVFARLLEANKEGYKYSYVKLFDNIASTPDILKLQTMIIRDLKGDEPDEIRSDDVGQKQIKSMLEKEEAFIYIDNVLLPADTREQGQDALTRLLPENMANAKKLRLLITTRNKDAASWMTMSKGVEKEFYPIQSLPEEKAVELLKKELHDNENQLDDSQIKGIVKICRGVPGLLKVLAGFINGGEGNAVDNCKSLMKEAEEKNWKGDIGESIEQYVFAYDKLEDKLKDAFLDICSFFRGWDWKELSDIVGETELKRLEQRALVTRDVESMTARVHDVILEVGLQRTEGNRFRLTTATAIEDFSDIEDEDLQKIKGIWASDNKYPLRIPASKLDLMSGSLRVLKLGPSTDVEGKSEKKFKELVFFSAITSHLPFYVSKLKGFEKLRHLCYNPADLQNLSQMPSSLRHIDFQLNSPLFQMSSKCIRQLSNLRVLRLANAQFESLPQELGDLGNSLEELSFSYCENLKELRASISSLGSLRVLRMDGCSGLTQLPKGLGSLKNCLQVLSLYGCKSLEALPSELENLTSLQKLYLSRCGSLKELPSSLGKLRSLQELILHSCDSLEALPPSLEELSSLRLLDLSGCQNIENLPCGLEKLTSLVELKLHHCNRLSSIPGTIGQLKLNSIDLACSVNLKELSDGFCNFSTLTELDMTLCERLEELPERFGEVRSLRKLTLKWCDSLKKLPESFSQLDNLEHLDLSGCSTLEELCKDFKGLSLLRVLSLQDCDKLKKLPKDFHCLTSLEVLDVRNCHKLKGKWIDNMLKMEKLQILRIAGSKLLEERWEKIQAQQCNQSWSCAVHTEQGLSNEENLLKQLQSKFDIMLTNGEREPLNISGLPLHTLLLVMFDGQQEFSLDFPLPLLEESIDDIQTHFEMVYFGNHFNKLPEKVANRIVGHAPANEDAKALFQKLLPLVVTSQLNFDGLLTSSFQMTAEIVSGEKGNKYLSRWKYFQGEAAEMEVEEIVVTKCGRYLKLKQLAERPGGSPIALLTELFPRGEEEISLSFLKNKDGEYTKVGVDELKGKTILLNIRPANTCYAIPLQALVEMYVVEKEKFGFEIITIPLMQKNTKMDVSVEFSREVPWLVLQNPWQLTNATKYFLVEGCPRRPERWDSWYANRMRIIESDGTMVPYRNPGVLRMVNTWGAAAYPFTAEKEEELTQKQKTQMEAMSHAMLLFQQLESVAEQLREAKGQQKMICLCCCHEKEFTNSMKDVLTELSDIIYIIIYIPNFRAEERAQWAHFTRTIGQWYSTVESSKMSAAEMPKMLWLSLSEYEAMRFWARIYSLKEIINFTDQHHLLQMLMNPKFRHRFPRSWMFMMDEDGNLITTKGKEIVELLSEKYSDDRVKELMQQLLEGTQTSRKKTLLELESMTPPEFETMVLMKRAAETFLNAIDGEDNEGYADDDE